VINKKRYEKKTEDIAFMWRNCLSLSVAAPTRNRWHKKRKNEPGEAKLDPMKNTADKITKLLVCTVQDCAVMSFQGKNV